MGEDYADIISLLQNMDKSMGKMVKESETVYQQAVKIRKRAEEVEALVNECLALMGQ